MNLLIHLLCLCPSPEELKEWNGNTEEPNNTHAFQIPGMWTAFLKDLTPLSLLDDIACEPPNKVESRPQLLEQIFKIAEMNEDFRIDGNGKSSVSCVEHSGLSADLCSCRRH